MKKQGDDASFAAVNETALKSDSEKTVSISSVAHHLNDLGLVAPTEEEMNTLRHVPDKINWAAYSKPSLVSRVLMTPVCL
jgi:POT family proton-dependent oligopeptide transporter